MHLKVTNFRLVYYRLGMLRNVNRLLLKDDFSTDSWWYAYHEKTKTMFNYDFQTFSGKVIHDFIAQQKSRKVSITIQIQSRNRDYTQ